MLALVVPDGGSPPDGLRAQPGWVELGKGGALVFARRLYGLGLLYRLTFHFSVSWLCLGTTGLTSLSAKATILLGRTSTGVLRPTIACGAVVLHTHWFRLTRCFRVKCNYQGYVCSSPVRPPERCCCIDLHIIFSSVLLLRNDRAIFKMPNLLIDRTGRRYIFSDLQVALDAAVSHTHHFRSNRCL